MGGDMEKCHPEVAMLPETAGQGQHCSQGKLSDLIG